MKGVAKYLGPLGLFTILVWLSSVVWGVIATVLTDKAAYIVALGIGSTSLLSFGRGYVYFIMNDCEYFQDVKRLNLKIDKHNKNLDDCEAKKAEIQA